AITISTEGGSVEIPDAVGRYDGDSVPNAGSSRSELAGVLGSLWDVHTFDITSIFTAPGLYTLALDGQTFVGDCTGLVLAIVDVRSNAAPVAIVRPTWSNVKAMYR